jgi:hypothetical protein
VRFALLVALVIHITCWGQSKSTGNAQTNAPCSPAITGSGNTVVLKDCGKVVKAPTNPVPKPELHDCPSRGEDIYKSCSDAQVGQWAIDESRQIESLTHDPRFQNGTREWSRWKFDQQFQECCSGLRVLRAELVRRLGPSGADVSESEMWTELFPDTKYAMADNKVDRDMALMYAPRLRRLGLRLKRREIPRSPTLRLSSEETSLVPGSVAKPLTFPYEMQITLKTPRELSAGYIVIELNDAAAFTATDFQTSELPGDEIENPALNTMRAQNPHGRVYVLKIAADPVVPEVPIHVFMGAFKSVHVIGAFWYDE